MPTNDRREIANELRRVANDSLMTLVRRYDGEPTVKVEIDTETELSISDGTSICGGMTANVTALGHIEHIKYCPFCGKNLQED